MLQMPGNPSTKEVEAKGPEVQGTFIHTEFKARSMGWNMRSCLNKTNKIKYKEDNILKNSALLNKFYSQKNKI